MLHMGNDVCNELSMDVEEIIGSYVHLRGHSQYSLLRGIGAIRDIVETAGGYGMSAIGVTDYDGMYGAVELYENAGDCKPIIGVELGVYTQQGTHKTMPTCVFIAKNTVGYHSLLRLVSVANLRVDEHPHVTWDDMRDHADGLCVLVGGYKSWFGLPGVHIDELSGWLGDLCVLYKKENVVVDYMAQQYDRVTAAYQHNVQIRHFKQLGYPTTVHNNYHYVRIQDADAFETALRIKDKNMRPWPGEYHIMSGQEIYDICCTHMDCDTSLTHKDILTMMQANMNLAHSINVQIALGKKLFPSFTLPKDAQDLYDTYRDKLITNK